MLAVLRESLSRNAVSHRARAAGRGALCALLLPCLLVLTEPAATRAGAAFITQSPVRIALAHRSMAVTPTRPDSTFDRELEAKAGERLRLDLPAGGDVTVRGWDEPRVRVRATLGGRDWMDERATVERRDGAVVVRAEWIEDRPTQSSRNTFTIDVPRRFDVDIRSAGGRLSILDVEGQFKGSSGGGGLELTRVKGVARLSTGGGDVQVTDAELSGSVSTGGGTVDLTGNRGDLSGSSGSGPVIDREPEESGVSAGAPRITLAGGPITLPRAPIGAVLVTGGGAVTVGPSAGTVRAHTGGGAIDIGPATGSVYASSGAGDVFVRLARDSAAQVVDVRSGSGRVRIEVPSDFGGRIELETAYTERHRATRITLPASWTPSRSATQAWDDIEGTPRRYVRAAGPVGSGRGLIRVKTVNGDIEIRSVSR